MKVNYNENSSGSYFKRPQEIKNCRQSLDDRESSLLQLK